MKLYGQTSSISLEEPYLSRLKKYTIAIIDSNEIYINDGNLKNLFYYALSPKSQISGVLVLFPSTGELVEDVFNNNIILSKIASDSNLLVIVPSINFNLCLDKFSLEFTNAAFKDVVKTFNLSKNNFVFGGFSLGGMNAIRYTEMAYENTKLTFIVPEAVYGVDPPLDLSRLYYSFENIIERNVFAPAVIESKSYLYKFNTQFGGSPDKFSDKYIQNSMYSKSQKNGGNSQYLKNVPVRIYSDPDIDWQLKYRYCDYYDMNALDQTAMINQLRIIGNSKAEYINALGKGYRLNGMRHPHSWSLVEPIDCIQWVLKCIQ